MVELGTAKCGYVKMTLRQGNIACDETRRGDIGQLS